MGGALILIAIGGHGPCFGAILRTAMYGCCSSSRWVSAPSAGTTTGGKSSIAIQRGCPAAGRLFLAVRCWGVAVAIFLSMTATVPTQMDLIVPFFKTVAYPLGSIGFVVLTYLVIVGASNAVNLTDGLDGLAIMPTVMIAGALAIFAYVAGSAVFSKYLLMPYIPGAGELAIFLGRDGWRRPGLPVVQRLSGRKCLWATWVLWRWVPHWGTVAVIVRQEIVLAIMGGVFVAETLSVAAQVLYFKFTGGKRIFRMAPLHHHFELGGWKETQVVVRFWIITIMLVLVGLSTLKIR